jgi:pyruvate/2-oxoglutarate dehydrogenase complex dihydrolipoamide dehydrogenase (E3) component
MDKYEAIIIGSGQAGNPLAFKLAAAGWRTALIEKEWVGGCCINVGCTPTKTLIASGRVAYLAKRSADFGVHTSGWSIDIEKVIRRKNEHVRSARNGSAKKLAETKNIDLIYGDAAFTGPKTLSVKKKDGSTASITAETIFLNAGCRPAVPPIPGLDGIDYLTSSSIMDLLVIPSHLVIIGAGYVALEFGQLYRRLGSAVTIIEHGQQFLPKEDEDISAEIRKILEEDGIRILTNTNTEKIGPGKTGAVVDVTIGANDNSRNNSREQIAASHVLVATGRTPNTETLNATVAGVALDKKGFVIVNDRLETSAPGIYALGDVKGGPQFTHISYNDQVILYKNLFEKANLSIAGRPAIYCMFTDPELGRVGLTETEARQKGLKIKVATMPAARIARAWENDETRGLLKAIVDAEKGTILGAAMLSSAGGELMTILQMAMMGNITYDVLRDNVFAHPTFAESLNNLFAGLDK